MYVDLSLDYFSLFGLPCQFSLDESALDRAWHALQGEAHPDRHAHRPEHERRAAMQGAVRINEAYAALKKPLTRARYRLELAGIGADALNSNVVAPEYLFEQLEWREAVEEARRAHDMDGLERLMKRLREQRGGIIALLAEQLDRQHDFEAAADTVRRLMFLEKLRAEVDNALAG